MGRILNVPEAFLKRHPFPGPGLAVRVLGDVTEGNALDILRQVCLVFLYNTTLGHLYHHPVFIYAEFVSRLMKSLFSQSKMLGFMIPSGKLLQCFCRSDQLGFKVIKEPILMLLLLELLRVRME